MATADRGDGTFRPVFEGLFWLTVVGIILFFGTLIVGIIRQRTRCD